MEEKNPSEIITVIVNIVELTARSKIVQWTTCTT